MNAFFNSWRGKYPDLSPSLLLFPLLLLLLLCVSCSKDDVNLPELESAAISKATTVSATAGGWVTSDGGGEITDKGVCWGLTSTPTISGSYQSAGSGIGAFTVTVTGLNPNTLYYARAYATNKEGTAYGEGMFMKTMVGTVTDIDGNVYQTVRIGNQEWMAENLTVTHYRNGDPIPHITDHTSWENTESGAYCWYDNDYQSYGQYYGAIYNRYTLSDPRGICPDGWHIPSNAEWQTLIDFLGGDYFATGKMKSAVTTSIEHPLPHPHWHYPNMDATNESGFSGFPGGFRSYFGGSFNALGASAYWWSVSLDEDHGQGLWISVNPGYIDIGRHNWNSGLSIRCIKN